MHYGYNTMWVNIELVEVPTLFVVGPGVEPSRTCRI